VFIAVKINCSAEVRDF